MNCKFDNSNLQFRYCVFTPILIKHKFCNPSQFMYYHDAITLPSAADSNFELIPFET